MHASIQLDFRGESSGKTASQYLVGRHLVPALRGRNTANSLPCSYNEPHVRRGNGAIRLNPRGISLSDGNAVFCAARLTLGHSTAIPEEKDRKGGMTIGVGDPVDTSGLRDKEDESEAGSAW
jgi:hypothetical protein